MIVTYWGVRGSVPSPGPHTVRFGGNTSCVGVEIDGRVLVLDAGTGIRALGMSLDAAPREVVLLFTHRHADHVQGLPFFDPLYRAAFPISILDHGGASGAWTALALFDGVHFPVLAEQLAPTVRRVEEDAPTFLRGLGVEVERMALNHPGGSFGYRLVDRGRSFVHLTDNELAEEGEGGEAFFRACVDFCRGADVLSHDAQYLAEEMQRYRGWGHSSVERVCDLAVAAAVKRLILFHHDPGRGDAELERIEEGARARLRGSGIECAVAYEGMVVEP